MPKKQKEVKVKEYGDICQKCKYHSNNPSFCNPFNKYVGRKSIDAETCAEYKKVKR